MAAASAALAYDPAAGAADAKRAAVLLVAAGALAWALARAARAPLALAPAAALWVSFVAWSALSLAWGAPAGAGTLAIWVGGAGLLVAALRLPEDEARRAAGIAAAVIVGGSALAALAQRAAGARGIALHGGHGNPNWLGLVLVVALPPAIDLAASLRRARSRAWPLAAAAAVLSVAALAVAHARVAWVAAAAALSLALVRALVRAPAARARPAWARAVATAALCAALGATALGVARLAGSAVAAAPRDGAPASRPDAPVSQPAAPGAPGAEDVPLADALAGRVWIWQSSADAARAALPFGVGLGRFAHAYLDAQGTRLARLAPAAASRRFVNATTAHNDWLEAAVEGGVPALALLAAAIVWGIAGALRGRFFAGALSLVALSICAVADSPLQQPGVVVVAALVLAALPRSLRPPRGARLGVAAPALALAAASLLLATATRTWIAVRRVTQARDAEPAARLALLASAARIDPRSGDAALALGLERLAAGDASGALRDLERSRALLANAGTDVAIGNASLALGAPERADAAYARALAWNPGAFRAHANRTEALVVLGRLDDAEAHLAAARALWPGHPKLPAIAERVRRARADARASGE